MGRHRLSQTGSGARTSLSQGRIITIADVFDALTSRRPYKAAFSLETSFGIIREGRGRHFDPKVVDAFFSVQDKVLAIMEKFQDP